MDNFFEWLLESSLLVLMILGIRKIFTGKIRYAGIYILWLIVLFRFLIPVNLISTPLSVGNVISGAVSSWRESNTADVYSGAAGFSGTALTQESEKDAHTQDFGAGSGKKDTSRLQSEQDRSKGMSHTDVWNILGIGRWLISGALFLCLLFSNLRLMRTLKRDRVLYGSRGRVKIYMVPHIKSPCLYGFAIPAVYLPNMSAAGGAPWTDEDGMKQIIMHECVHYRHGDHIWSMLCMVLVSVYWYDPFLWLAVGCFKKDAELFCDETVIGMLGEKKRFSYGRLLLSMAGDTGWGDFRYSMVPMSRRGKEMKRRICAISAKKHYTKRALLPLVFAVAIAFGLTCSTGFAPFAKKETAQVSSTVWPQARDLALFQNAQSLVPADGEQQFPVAGQMGLQDASSYHESCQETFGRYISIFTEAVNAGDPARLNEVLAEGSEVYEQQSAIVANYHKRGIREKVISCSVTAMNDVGFRQVEIQSKEKIRVYYKDGKSKIVRQKYRYTCEERGGNCMITQMDEIPA